MRQTFMSEDGDTQRPSGRENNQQNIYYKKKNISMLQ